MKAARQIAVYGAYQRIGADAPQKLLKSKEAFQLVFRGKADYRDSARAIKMRLPESIEVYRDSESAESGHPESHVSRKWAIDLVAEGATPANNDTAIILTERQGGRIKLALESIKDPDYRGLSSKPNANLIHRYAGDQVARRKTVAVAAIDKTVAVAAIDGWGECLTPPNSGKEHPENRYIPAGVNLPEEKKGGQNIARRFASLPRSGCVAQP